MSRMDQVFKAYDVRGTVPDQLDADMCRAIGRAMARFAGAPRDPGRPRHARVRRGALGAPSPTACGPRASTSPTSAWPRPTSCTSRRATSTRPGAMFTASHNPAQYNGLKLCLSGARPIGRDTGLADIEAERREAARRAAAAADGAPGASWTCSASGPTTWCRSSTSASLRPLKVVADTANGMGGLVVPIVFDRLPFSVEILFPELDGTFPNHPADPIQPENLVDLKAAVLEQGADIGLAFDGDADRVFLVDEKAEPVSGSLTTALVAASMLTKHPGETILYNLICSHVVPEVVTELGGTPCAPRWATPSSSRSWPRRAPSSAASTRATTTTATTSGPTRASSPRCSCWSCSARAGNRSPSCSSPTSATRTRARSTPRWRARRPPSTPSPTHERAAGASVDLLDGLTVEHADWWYNVRPSNTEPLLRLNVEARTPERCAAHVAEVQELIAANAGLARRPELRSSR